ncbi:MAG: hypothetical protein Q8P49_00735 [Candidatus Liptonbacteria bacterium]|nr:hypothetical protein [Candidatus Liptonbacteria bacterium]
MRRVYLFTLMFLAATFLLVAHARAATMYMVPDARSLSIGQEFNVDLKIDTGDASTSINSAQATIQFPVGILNAISVDKQNSVFGFWLEEPTISISDGTIRFIGGAIKGVSGNALQVVRMKFKATGAGLADLKISDAAVAAADGKGTNVLAETKGVSVAVGTNTLSPSPAPPAATNIEQPQIIYRTPVKAAGLPAKPVLRVPLYPDESRWYDQIGDVIVLWDLPVDITQVAARVSHAKDGTAPTPEKALSNGKNFGVLQEDIWYVKVQFRNNIGWGEPAYYKISIDTTPPLPFDIKISNAASDDPSPKIDFETNDSLSGIANYAISVDGKELAIVTSTTAILPAQLPGRHSLTVKATDLAGNSVEDGIGFEVLPLPTPQIEFITKSISQGEFAFASGKGTPGGSVEVIAVDAGNREVFRGTAGSDDGGHWDVTVKVPLAIGEYQLSARSHDTRGAQSFMSDPRSFKVKAKSIISFGFIELGWLEILIIVILAVVASISIWSRRNIMRAQTRGAYKVILGRDVEKLSALLSENIKELSQIPSVRDGADAPKFAYLIAKLNENIAKIKKYIGQEAEKLK